MDAEPEVCVQCGETVPADENTNDAGHLNAPTRGVLVVCLTVRSVRGGGMYLRRGSVVAAGCNRMVAEAAAARLAEAVRSESLSERRRQVLEARQSMPRDVIGW